MADNIESRNVYLWGEIDSETSRDLVDQLFSMRACNDPVNLYINSTGGSVYDAVAIIDSMGLMPFKVNAIAIGCCYSAAFLVLACSTGVRCATPHARMMYHPISVEAGYINHVEASVLSREFRHTWNAMGKLLSEATGGRINISKFSRHDKFLSPQECLNLGVIDQII